MKKLIVLTVLVLSLTITVLSQSCLPNGITFSTQEQIDNFQFNFPGCTEIEGNVTIEGEFIENLNGLDILTTIGGDLQIALNPILTDITGLINLSTISGDLKILSNDLLESLEGLNNLSYIGGDLRVGEYYYYYNRTVVKSLEPLSSLTAIGGSLSIIQCDSLTYLDGLENITSNSITQLNIYNNEILSSCDVQSVCDFLSNPSGEINIYNNADGCNNPPQIADDCGISLNCLPYGNYHFMTQEEIDSFQSDYSSCNNLTGHVIIIGENITNISGLNNVTSIEKGLTIGQYYFGNDSLTNLSGLNNLTRIGGDLTIMANDTLTNISGLNNLDTIYGRLHISGNHQLSSLSGLENLRYIGIKLDISSTYYLQDLTELNNLNSIGGDINLHDNLGLKNLSGLENIDTIYGNVSLINNDSLINLNGLHNVKYIKENFFIRDLAGHEIFSSSELNEVGGNLSIEGNDSLTGLTGLENLSKIVGNLYIEYNQSLEEISALNNLSEIVGDLKIDNNPYLQSLTGLDNLIPGSISNIFIHYNDSLSNCDALGICEYLSNPKGSINIYDNKIGCNSPAEIASDCGITLPCLPFGNYFLTNQNHINNFNTDYPGCSELKGNVFVQGIEITNLNGISQITTVENNLYIRNSPQLTNLSGLENLHSIGDYLSISQNWGLITTEGLSNLDYIGKDFIINNNINLIEITECNQLTTIGGKLEIESNPSLLNISCFRNLDTIGGDFDLVYNKQLNNLSSFSSLKSIGGRLKLRGNEDLNTLLNFSNITSINGDLHISVNASLSSLSGLDNIDNNSISNLTIRQNESLSECDIESICAYLVSPEGEINISENDNGCYDRDQVEYECTLGIYGETIERPFLFYPNPAHDELNITLKDDITIRQVSIFNQFGQRIINNKENTENINVSGLKPGLYIIEVELKNQKYRQKFIKN